MREKYLSVMKEILGENDEIKENHNLREIGVNSIIYVQILVNLEEEMDFEYPDELLNYNPELSVGEWFDTLESVGN